MKNITGVTCVLVAGAAFMAGQASADQEVTDPWSLSATVGSQYTDNRDGTKANKESNVDVTAAPRLDLRIRGERSLLNLFIEPGVKWHSNPRTVQEGDPQNETDLYGAGGVDLGYYFSPRTMIKLGDTLTYADDPEITERGASVRRSDNHWLNTVYGNLGVEVSEKTDLTINGRDSIKRYTDNVVAQDQDEDVVDTDANLKYLTGMGVSVFGTVGYSDFSNRSTERDRGSQVLTYGVGLEKMFNPDFVATVRGGYQTAKYDDRTLDDVDTGNARADVVLRGASSTRFRAGASYGFSSPNVRPYSLQTLSAVFGSVEHDVLANLTVALRGQYADGDYKRESATLPGGHDKLTTVGVDGNYRFNRHLALRLGYTYENWDSDVRESFDRNTVDVALKADL